MIRNLNGVSSLSKRYSSNRAKHELSPSILPQRFPKFVVRSTDQNVLFQAFSSMLQQQTPNQTGCYLKMKDVTYQPTGSTKSILDHINLDLEANKLGLIFGKSGSGKTTLLQVIAGLTEQDSGRIYLAKTLPLDSSISAKNRLQRVGMVFQFPERHFLGHTIRSELTFGWPRATSAVEKRIQRVQFALMAVGLTSFDLDTPTQNLSDGYKRRLALAVQLVRQPSLLLLDEPLAGLDWKARDEMVKTLNRVKKECTILVVSHDLKEIKPHVDAVWKMTTNGHLVTVNWPNT